MPSPIDTILITVVIFPCVIYIIVFFLRRCSKTQPNEHNRVRAMQIRMRRRLAQERAAARFEENQVQRFEDKYHLNSDDREKRKKRVMGFLVVKQYKSKEDESQGLETVELGVPEAVPSTREETKDCSEKFSALEDEVMHSGREGHAIKAGSDDNFFTWALRSISNFIMPAEEQDPPTKIVSSRICSICMEDYTSSDEICHSKSVCGHIYHVECLMDWMMRNADCPICRAVIISPVSDDEESC